MIGLFAVQNAQPLTVSFLAWSFTLSQALVIFCAGLTGLVIGLALGTFGRRGRE
jgi:uncharacterized integral membrane protein